MTQAYLHFGFGEEPRQTVAVESREKPMPHHLSGLSWTPTGYGHRIPSALQVKWEGRWRRVYVCVFGNSGTSYIGPSAEWQAVVSTD